MSDYDYDLFVIGAGSGGVRAARVAAMAGGRVAIAEEDRIGGTCVIRGCVPKKFMVYASEFKQHFEDAKGYGWSFPEPPKFEMTPFMNALHAEVDRLSGIYRRNLDNSGVDVIEDRAELKDRHTIHLVNEDRTVTAEKILVAVGGWPVRPDIEGADLGIVSNDVFHLDKVPEHIVIVGGGYIACEFADIFRGLGSEVCLVYRRDVVLRGFDDDIRTHVTEGMKRNGVRIITHANVDSLKKTGDGRIRVNVSDDSEIEADQVLFAIGRKPKTETLGLDSAGVDLDETGAIKVDEYSKSNVDNIWAVGDVTNRMNLTPVAIREGQAFAETEFNESPMTFDHDKIATGVFTQPPVGTVGLSEAEARKQFKVDVYKARFFPMKEMLTGDSHRMMMKLIVRQEDQVVVGCHIVGPDAPEVIQAVGIAVKAGLTKKDFDRTCAVHPTAAEELVTMKEKFNPVGINTS